MDQVAEIREHIDLVSLISEFVPLKKAGQNFKANCPFHNEKSPSFVVSPERQIWHCFGCQKGGDAYTFLMEYERIEFVEALRFLAQKTGIELKQTGFSAGVSSQKEKIYTLNQLALELYRYILTKHQAGKNVLAYLSEKRQITPAIINTFGLGFAPASGQILTNYLIKKKQYKKEDLMEAGLAIERYGRVRDFFTNRLIFPLIDHRDNVVGFSGRIMEEGDGPKYVNTKETLAYHKGSHFFGLSVTKTSIKKEGKAIVVEGEFDVMSSFQAGVSNVVALKGTALTPDQVNLLSRFTSSVALCLDQDEPGRDAMKRSLLLLGKKGITTTIIVPFSGKDPDESIRENEGLFKKSVKEEKNIYEYLFDQAVAMFDKKTAEGKKEIAAQLFPYFSQIGNEIIKEHFLKKLSAELDTTYESISKEAARFHKADTAVTIPVEKNEKQKRSRQIALEEYLLSLLLQYDDPKVALGMIEKIIDITMFENLSYRQIYARISEYAGQVTVFDTKQFSAGIPQELLALFHACCLFPLAEFSSFGDHLFEIEKKAKELRDLSLRSQIKELGEKIKQKEKDGEEEEVGKLQVEYSKKVLLLKKTSADKS